MRILLRDARTGLYFRGPGEWTAEIDRAQNFRHSAEAMDQARVGSVQDAEVVLAFEEPRYTVALPVPGAIPTPAFGFETLVALAAVRQQAEIRA
jgi:hypothetical protein